MPRPFAFTLAALALAAFGCARPPADVAPVAPASAPAPAPRAAALPVAPMPHLPGERVTRTAPEDEENPLKNEDIGLDPRIEAALPEIERLDPITDPAAVVGPPPVPGGEIGSGNTQPATPFAGRSGATKTRLLKERGGNAASELAVARGLAWLAKQQSKDGSWVFDAGLKGEPAAATGLALLPFLGAGETHKQATKYKNEVNRGLQWLIKDIVAKDKDAGRFAGAKTPFGQAVATLALVEAYSLTKDPALKAPAQAAVNYIQSSQAANGSWADAGADRDTSLVGWPVQALKAAKLTQEFVVDDKVIQKAAAFLDTTAAGPRKSMFGHKDNTGAQPGTALTAAALLCRYSISDWGPNHPGLIDGAAGLVKNMSAGGAKLKSMYYSYHATQVLHFLEGEDWKTWNEGPKGPNGTRKGGMRDWLIGQQVQKDGAERGSWEPEDGFFGQECGRLGTTAIAVLTLEVYYRHLPLYKRGADGNAIKIIE